MTEVRHNEYITAKELVNDLENKPPLEKLSIPEEFVCGSLAYCDALVELHTECFHMDADKSPTARKLRKILTQINGRAVPSLQAALSDESHVSVLASLVALQTGLTVHGITEAHDTALIRRAARSLQEQRDIRIRDYNVLSLTSLEAQSFLYIPQLKHELPVPDGFEKVGMLSISPVDPSLKDEVKCYADTSFHAADLGNGLVVPFAPKGYCWQGSDRGALTLQFDFGDIEERNSIPTAPFR